MKNHIVLLGFCGLFSCSISDKEAPNLEATVVSDSFPQAIAVEIDHDSIEIRFGRSFGMCEGYCRSLYKLNSRDLKCFRFGWDTIAFPTQYQILAVSRVQYEEILNAVDTIDIWSEFDVVQIGCPDCADGGRCWIEVLDQDELKRFDYDCMGGPGPHRAFTEIIWNATKDVRWWEPGDLYMPLDPGIQ